MKTFLFGVDRIATAISGDSEYGHTFGGPHDRQGISRADCQGILNHLLLRLDLGDPAVPIDIPGIRWLPFYYCFDFRANEVGYRLTSDDSAVVYYPTDDPNVSSVESWPGDNYPLEFPKSPVRITKFAYDPTKFDDAYLWAGIFGIDKLSKAGQARARKRAIKEMDGLGLRVPTTPSEISDALSSPFTQGKPRSDCLNPECKNHSRPGSLSTIALMPAEPVADVHTFGEFGTGVELVFQKCPQCHTIRVSNQCD